MAARKRRRLKLGPSAHEIAGRGKLYMTVYAENGGSCCGEIEAASLVEATRIAGARNLGERIIARGHRGKPMTAGIAELLLKPKRTKDDIVKAIHEACFLGFVGQASGALTARELLADGGLIHQLVHMLQHQARPELVETCAKMAREFEGRVPGWPSPPVSERKRRRARNRGR